MTPADEECNEKPEGCPGSRFGGISPRDPAFDEGHSIIDFGRKYGQCRQCHQQIWALPDPEDLD